MSRKYRIEGGADKQLTVVIIGAVVIVFLLASGQAMLRNIGVVSLIGLILLSL